MANKRMFSMDIVSSDAFLDMPTSSRELYFQLGMYADDEGFVNPKKVMRLTGASDDDLKVLVMKRFVLPFKSGVVVIKHWLIHNTIRMDRFNPTQYQEEKNQLSIKENKSYTELATKRQPEVAKMVPQVKLSQVNSEEVNSEKERGAVAPTPASIARQFFAEKIAQDAVIKNLVGKGVPQYLAEREIKKFIHYWTELNKSGRKQRWELEKVFELNRRLATWFGKANDFKNIKEQKGIEI